MTLGCLYSAKPICADCAVPSQLYVNDPRGDTVLEQRTQTLKKGERLLVSLLQGLLPI